MQWTQGDMLECAKQNGINTIAFTANSCIGSDGALVMGAGAAKRVRDAFPGVGTGLAAAIPTGGDYHIACHVYGADVESTDYSQYHAKAIIVAVQVKRDWQDPGDWDLTVTSLKQLAAYLYYRTPQAKAVLNCPLIGHGGWRGREVEVMRMVEEILADIDIVVCRM